MSIEAPAEAADPRVFRSFAQVRSSARVRNFRAEMNAPRPHQPKRGHERSSTFPHAHYSEGITVKQKVDK